MKRPQINQGRIQTPRFNTSVFSEQDASRAKENSTVVAKSDKEFQKLAKKESLVVTSLSKNQVDSDR